MILELLLEAIGVGGGIEIGNGHKLEFIQRRSFGIYGCLWFTTHGDSVTRGR